MGDDQNGFEWEFCLLLGLPSGYSLVAQMVKYMPTMQETWVQSLGREGPLEKEMAIHSSTLAWKIPWMEECGRLQSMESQRVRHGCMTLLIPSQEPLNKEQRNIYSVN